MQRNPIADKARNPAGRPSRTLVVAGALLPAAQAAPLLAAARVPRLAARLGSARLQASEQAGARSQGAAHWSWLARRFGLPDDPPVTAPYAWRALGSGTGAEVEAGAGAEAAWIAHCEPIHIVVARDHLRAIDLGVEPLAPAESATLLALANEAAREAARAAHGGMPPLRFAVRAGHWFVHAPAALSIHCHPLDAVLGRSIQGLLPQGAHARAWRVLENEIEMMWHASAVHAAREERGAPTANGLWLHGGGPWRALPAHGLALPQDARAACGTAAQRDGAILQGWLQAGAAGAAGAHGTLDLDHGLLGAFVQRAWDPWLEGLAALEDRVELEMQRAARDGAAALDLVLCGAHEARTYRLPLRAGASGWQALGAWLRPRSGPATLDCLVETEAAQLARPRAA